MWRLVILAILLIVVYFMVRSAFRGLLGKRQDHARGKLSERTSEMVQDPVCGMFVPKEGALFIRGADRTYFFCGNSCRDIYEKKPSSV
jgi:YHS domain-containing protein